MSDDSENYNSLRVAIEINFTDHFSTKSSTQKIQKFQIYGHFICLSTTISPNIFVTEAGNNSPCDVLY